LNLARIKRDSSLTMFVLNDYLYWYCHSETRSVVESSWVKTKLIMSFRVA